MPTRSRIGLPRLAGTLRKAQPGKGRPVRSATERSRACHQVSLSCACRTAVPERSSSLRNLTTGTSSWSRADSRGSGIRPHPACRGFPGNTPTSIARSCSAAPRRTSAASSLAGSAAPLADRCCHGAPPGSPGIVRYRQGPEQPERQSHVRASTMRATPACDSTPAPGGKRCGSPGRTPAPRQPWRQGRLFCGSPLPAHFARATGRD